MKPKRPNYIPDLLRLAADLAPGEVHHMTVYHDDWCRELAGTGPCNCQPVIKDGRPGRLYDA